MFSQRTRDKSSALVSDYAKQRSRLFSWRFQWEPTSVPMYVSYVVCGSFTESGRNCRCDKSGNAGITHFNEL